MRKYIITLVSLVVAVAWPSSVEAEVGSVPIEQDVVDVQNLVDHFGGQRLLDRSEDDRHFVEYLFDGHSLKRFENETIMWLNGEPVPYGFGYVDDIRIPLPGRQTTLSRGFQLPVDFLEHYLGYTVNKDRLVVEHSDDDTFHQPSGTTVEGEPEDIDEDEQPDVTDDNNDGYIDEEVWSEPSEDESESEDTSDGGQATDKEVTQEPDGDASLSEPEDILDEVDKENPPGQSNEEEKQGEDELAVEDEPSKKGEGRINMDRADVGFKHTQNNPSQLEVSGETFYVFFEDERTVNIRHDGTDERATMETHRGMTQSFQFYLDNGDYVVLTIEVEDSRNAGLTEQRVRERIGAIHPDIVVDMDESDVHLFLEHVEFNLREELFKKTERTLVKLGVQRFQYKQESGRWDVWFNLYDSDWG